MDLRVGYYRVLEVLERHGIHATVCFNAFAAERHPQLVERALRGGHGLAARGLTSRQIISSEMSEDDERAYIQQTLDTLEQAAGRRMLGWAGQDMGESTATPRLLHEAGLTHVIDWPNDDQPYPMPVAGPDAATAGVPAKPDGVGRCGAVQRPPCGPVALSGNLLVCI